MSDIYEEFKRQRELQRKEAALTTDAFQACDTSRRKLKHGSQSSNGKSARDSSRYKRWKSVPFSYADTQDTVIQKLPFDDPISDSSDEDGHMDGLIPQNQRASKQGISTEAQSPRKVVAHRIESINEEADAIEESSSGEEDDSGPQPATTVSQPHNNGNVIHPLPDAKGAARNVTENEDVILSCGSSDEGGQDDFRPLPNVDNHEDSNNIVARLLDWNKAQTKAKETNIAIVHGGSASKSARKMKLVSGGLAMQLKRALNIEQSDVYFRRHMDGKRRASVATCSQTGPTTAGALLVKVEHLPLPNVAVACRILSGTIGSTIDAAPADGVAEPESKGTTAVDIYFVREQLERLQLTVGTVLVVEQPYVALPVARRSQPVIIAPNYVYKV